MLNIAQVLYAQLVPVCIPSPEHSGCSVAGATSSGSCLACEVGSYSSTTGQSTCIQCLQGSYTTTSGSSLQSACTQLLTSKAFPISGQPLTSTAANIVQIFQFKAQYQLSEISQDIQDRMTIAVANLLLVNKSSVILSFASVSLQRQFKLRVLLKQEGVLDGVGLSNFYESTSAFNSLISQQSINYQMAAQKLKPVILVMALSGSTVSTGMSKSECSVASQNCSAISIHLHSTWFEGCITGNSSTSVPSPVMTSSGSGGVSLALIVGATLGVILVLSLGILCYMKPKTCFSSSAQVKPASTYAFSFNWRIDG